MISFLNRLFFGKQRPGTFVVHLVMVGDKITCAYADYNTACYLADDYAGHGIKASVITQTVIDL